MIEAGDAINRFPASKRDRGGLSPPMLHNRNETVADLVASIGEVLKEVLKPEVAGQI